ncbi:MAG: ABC transporter permease [Treponema sp.]|nr:ABC transporter permease [Treponema sp.]MCL2272812.1 ABC transporter permease [Treponema sp.]
MRSLLTSLGIIIGVGSVIVMVAMGEGSQRAIEERISAMGTNLLQINHRPPPRHIQTTYTRRSAFSKEDLEKLKDESTYTSAISGVVQNNNTNVIGGEGSVQVRLQGVEPDFLIARNWNVNAGYFFEEEDLALRNTVAVLGRTTAKNLFGDAEKALAQQIRIGTEYFTVIGLFESKGADLDGRDQDDIIIVPMDTAMTRLNNSPYVNHIVISVIGREYMETAQREIELLLRESRQIPDGINSDFAVTNQSDTINMASETSRILTGLLTAIAAISLLVGGIGIMNIMLVSVTERTKEIGIRMAVGARKRDILFQFLAESVILSLMGGVMGIGMAFLACRILSNIGVPTTVNPLIVAVSAMFAALVGILFGYYPALKAAKLYPIEALRYE